VKTNEVATATVFIRITSTNGGAIVDTNSFTVAVACSPLTTTTIINFFLLLPSIPAVSNTNLVDATAYSAAISNLAICPLTY